MGNGFVEFLFYMALYKEQFASPVSYWPNVIGAAVGACLGALLGFATAQYHHQLTQRQNLWNQHLKALQQLQVILNQNLEFINRNGASFTTIEQLKSSEQNGRVVGWLNFSELYYEWSLITEGIRNLKLLNLLLSYNLKVSKTNSQHNLVLRMIDDIRNAQFAKHVTVENGRELLDRIPVSDLKKWNDFMAKETEHILAYLRVLYKVDKPHAVWQFIRKKRLISIDIADEEVEAMKIILDAEFRQVQEKSKKQIIDTFGNDYEKKG